MKLLLAFVLVFGMTAAAEAQFPCRPNYGFTPYYYQPFYQPRPFYNYGYQPYSYSYSYFYYY